MHRAIKEFFLCCTASCHFSAVTESLCAVSSIALTALSPIVLYVNGRFYSSNQITTLLKHYPCYQILIIFFTFGVIFHCATNSHVEHIMAFVLIPAVNQRPVLKLAYLCYHQLKLFFGAAWKSNIELFFSSFFL